MKIYGQKPKRGKNYGESHTEPTKYGMGDYYGTGVRNKFGRLRDSSNPGFIPLGERGLKTPPKSLA